MKENDQNISFYLTKDSFKYLHKVKSEIPSTVQTCQQLIGQTSLPHVKIIFYDKLKRLDKYSNLNDVFAYYDTKDRSINLWVPKYHPQNVISNMRHEFTHYYFNSMLKENNIDRSAFPIWFHEGLASYIANQHVNYKDYSTAGIIPLNSLNTSEQWQKAMKSSINPYGESYVAIQLLIEKRGNDVIKKIIKNVLKGEDFYTSFKKASNLTEKQLDAIIKHYYAKKRK